MAFTDNEICRKCGSGIEHHALENGKWICPPPVGGPAKTPEEN